MFRIVLHIHSRWRVGGLFRWAQWSCWSSACSVNLELYSSLSQTPSWAAVSPSCLVGIELHNLLVRSTNIIIWYINIFSIYFLNKLSTYLLAYFLQLTYLFTYEITRTRTHLLNYTYYRFTY